MQLRNFHEGNRDYDEFAGVNRSVVNRFPIRRRVPSRRKDGTVRSRALTIPRAVYRVKRNVIGESDVPERRGGQKQSAALMADRERR